MNRAEELLAECSKVWAPPPKQTLSEWAEATFYLSPEYSAQSGQLRLHSFQRDIFDSFTDPYVNDIVVMCATQMVKTLFLQAIVAYVIARDPGPILLAQPTETDAETFSKERLAPMIRDMECLRTRVAPEKRTSKANTTLHKMFPGGSLSLIGAQTAGNFARRTIKVFLADERDKWLKNVGKEGDGYSLGVKRTARFRSRAKRVQVCSPTVKGDSAIAAAYELTDQQKRWVPCPACGQHQILKWGQVKDPRLPGKQPDATGYECEYCGALWGDAERWDACDRGEWRADRPSINGKRGFWISELYCEWRRLSDLVDDFLAKKDNPAELQTFINTSLAELWEQAGEAPDWEKLMSRREDSYRLGQVPGEVLFLTAGVDVQKSWLEGYVWGWGRNRERWLIDHWRFDGDPFGDAAWDWLTECLNSTYRKATGAEMGIAKLALDTGYQSSSSATDATQEAYQFARRHGAHRVLAVDGRDRGELVGYPTLVDITIRGRKIPNGCKLWPVNVSRCKSELYGLLNRERAPKGEIPPGTVHFPINADEEFFRQLTAERFVLGKGGKGHWEKDGGTR
ncbi:MAG: terminase gpA endonuclease subunit, partial [Bryobacteraceae bacterium]